MICMGRQREDSLADGYSAVAMIGSLGSAGQSDLDRLPVGLSPHQGAGRVP
jgi:hypothetical protein